jgi:hypothetical protein
VAKKRTWLQEQLHAARKAERKAYVDGLRDGRKLRATTFADKGKVNNKRACRGKHTEQE